MGAAQFMRRCTRAITFALLVYLFAAQNVAASLDESTDGYHAVSRGLPVPGPMLGLVVLKAHPRFNTEGEWVPGSGEVALYSQPLNGSAVVETVKPEQLLGEEHDYEMPAALVVARAPGWLGVARWSATRPVLRWVPESEVVRFLPMSELLAQENLTYLTSSWNGRFHIAAEGALMAIPKSAALDDGRPTIQVVAVVQRKSGLWLEVEILDRVHCQGEPGKPLGRAFVPTLDKGGRPMVWFWSRGC